MQTNKCLLHLIEAVILNNRLNCVKGIENLWLRHGDRAESRSGVSKGQTFAFAAKK